MLNYYCCITGIYYILNLINIEYMKRFKRFVNDETATGILCDLAIEYFCPIFQVLSVNIGILVRAISMGLGEV